MRNTFNIITLAKMPQAVPGTICGLQLILIIVLCYLPFFFSSKDGTQVGKCCGYRTVSDVDIVRECANGSDYSPKRRILIQGICGQVFFLKW